MKSDKKNYIIIIIYGLILLFCLLGFNNLYGSNVDWISQHSVIPNYFREIFYETKNILPSFAFNLGAGQNIFNYSYYGLLSPIILLSYLFPFIDMTTYIMIISIILYLLSGCLMYYFLKDNNFKNSISLFSSMMLLTMAPMFHFHHHIMFVWYIPFLITSLIGVNRYVNKNKSSLLMISMFLLIMTNYYYSVSSILVILIYGVYKLLSKSNFKLKTFIFDIILAIPRVITPILLAGILIFPSANIILSTGRGITSNIQVIKLFLPNIIEIIYKAFSMGLTGILIISLLSLLCTKRKNISEIFLSISLLIICFIPLFMWLLNGMLYIRGKVLIPFITLFIFIFAKLMNNIKEDNINIKRLIIISSIFLLIIILVNKINIKTSFLILDFIISLITIYLYKKYHKELIIYIPLFIILLLCCISNNQTEIYVSKNEYNKINTKDVINLTNKINDKYVRTINNYYALENANKYYNDKYYSTSIYSSNYNSYYWNFYNNIIGNNIYYRNLFITSGADNYLFNKIMGVKYIITDKDEFYDLIDTSNNIKLYYNKDAYPLIYETSKYGSISEFEKLKYPYNIEYMLSNPVVDNNSNIEYESNIKVLNWDLDDTYEFELEKNKNYTYNLDKPIKDKLLIIKFKMNNSNSCSKGDTEITINGIKNKLTCRSWMYHNNNYLFEYVINENNIEKLDISLSKGKYNISDIEIYTMDYINNNYTLLDNLKIDKKKSIISGKSNLDEDGYIITSIPYDKGFKVYVDKKLVDSEIVNKAFLGFRVPSGNHDIKITYLSPWLILGIISSFFGICAFILLMIYEKFMMQINEIIIKNKEILLYLIFGFLTTVVSIGSYYILTHTLLDPNNKLFLQIANVLSWVIAATFAYITNRIFVFTSKNKNILKEAIKFYESRVVTLLIDMLLMFIFVSLLSFNDVIIKIIVQVIVVVLNYIFSKIMVFKGR